MSLFILTSTLPFCNSNTDSQFGQSKGLPLVLKLVASSMAILILASSWSGGTLVPDSPTNIMSGR